MPGRSETKGNPGHSGLASGIRHRFAGVNGRAGDTPIGSGFGFFAHIVHNVTSTRSTIGQDRALSCIGCRSDDRFPFVMLEKSDHPFLSFQQLHRSRAQRPESRSCKRHRYAASERSVRKSSEEVCGPTKSLLLMPGLADPHSTPLRFAPMPLTGQAIRQAPMPLTGQACGLAARDPQQAIPKESSGRGPSTGSSAGTERMRPIVTLRDDKGWGFQAMFRHDK